MRKATPVLFLSALALLACVGCRTVHRNAEMARSSVMSGDGSVAVERARKMSESKFNRTLGIVETGRLRQLQGDRAGSSAAFKPELERLFADDNEGSLVKGADVGGQLLAGTVADDTAIPYALPPFEMMFALQYQFLNELAAGDFDTAGVYLRRAAWLQERLREKNGGVEPPPADEASKENAEAAAKAVGELDAKLAPIADTVRASYENALVWYLRGLWLACDSQESSADLAYAEAAKIAPATGLYPKRGGRDVTVIYEEGLVDLRYPVKIPLPLGGTVVSCDFPVYRGDPYRPCEISATLGTNVTTLSKVVDVQALGYRDLKDRIPGMVTRNVTRTAVKIAAQQAVNHIDTGSSGGNLALRLGVLAYNAINTVVCEADTRCWTTLPECVQFARLARGADENVLRLSRLGRDVDVVLPEKPRGPVVVWVSDIGSSASVTVLEMAPGAVAAPAARVSSLVGAGDGRFR